MARRSKRISSDSKAVRPARRVRPKKAKRGGRGPGGVVRKNLAPLFLSSCILIGIIAMALLGYRSVTASNFFEIAEVNIQGTVRASAETVKRIVLGRAERSGVWNADLAEIRAKIEEQPFVRSASVTRMLPNGIRVQIFEHEPKAIVRLKDGDHLVNGEGRVLARSEGVDHSIPFAILGWDEAKSEKADKENAERVRIFAQMLSDWSDLGIADRVENVDLRSIREPRAIIRDSGSLVSIALGRDNFGENLSRGIRAIAGKGNIFEAVDLVGANMILAPRKQQNEKPAAR
ncbi:MAG TPA: FtsQ-type POTRA domain-containing protein [Pyrinomonadaceae bacterium]|nr:FtsQ-type POTRA domain-containing protein [Pyrinomonadaceae bacterium]HMP67062.1 FtsQ-type POTRA domain-containing protein [Pyrinomonadaceae bacterium]